MIVCNKIFKLQNLKRDKYFVDEVETQLREKLLQGAAKPRISTIQKTKLVHRK
jgi:uncharacterized membrane protein YcaP (DUF421 family)